MPEGFTDEDFDLLIELGIDTTPTPSDVRSTREQRIITGFEEILRFVETYNRIPEHGEHRDIFERLYAVRLDRLRELEEYRQLLQSLDTHGILDISNTYTFPTETDLSDEELLTSLGIEASTENDITKLVHVRSRAEIKAAEEVAQRTPCEDFDIFRPIFNEIQHQLATGERETIKYQDNAAVEEGQMFILDGQKIIVAELGELFVGDHGRPDRRLRVVYDNGTESDLLLRSLQRALNKDKSSRRITKTDFGPLFSDIAASDDILSGTIYVLRSKSEHPFIAQNRMVIHKIGVTGGSVKNRIANAQQDPTYLLADVEIVATFKLVNINRKKLERLIHQFFSNAQLDLELQDRFGLPVKPREWFLVPLEVIEEAIDKIKAGTIDQFEYDPKTAKITGI